MPGRRSQARTASIAALLAALTAAACGSSTHHKAQTHAQTAATSTPTASTHPKTTASRPKSTPTRPKKTTTTAPHAAKAPPSTPVAGLRGTPGYSLYELCSGQCSGSVPASIVRPLHIPGPGPGGSCPTSAGRGPVKPSGPPNLRLQPFLGSSWQGAEVTWRSSPGYRGPVLIRGRQVGGAGVVGFGEGHVPYEALELLDSAKGAPPGPSRTWPSFTRVHAPGCYAYQVDGTSFSEVIVFRAS